MVIRYIFLFIIFNTTIEFKIDLRTKINKIFQFCKTNFIKIIDNGYEAQINSIKIKLNNGIPLNYYFYSLENKNFFDNFSKFKIVKARIKSDFEKKMLVLNNIFNKDTKHNKKDTNININFLDYFYRLKNNIINKYSLSFADLFQKIKAKIYKKITSPIVVYRKINREDYVYFSNYINKLDNDFFLDDYEKPQHDVLISEKKINDILKENDEFKDYFGEKIQKNYRFNAEKYISLIKNNEKIFIEKIKEKIKNII